MGTPRDRVSEPVAGRASEPFPSAPASSQELSELTYALCHDLQAPLRAIRGFGQLLSEQHADGLGADGRKLLDLVLANAARMRQQIDGLMRFAAIGTATLRPQPVDMDGVARVVYEELRQGDAQREVECQIAPLPPATGDSEWIRDLWGRLISNALKFSRESPAAAIDIGCDTTSGEPVYWVRDNGVGFDMRFAGRLFEIFQRLHSLDDFPGAGVGLAIAKRTVERHGGRIWATASPDEGATFYFTFGASS
jgi:light-regulated signal transduction histidine kinase (bacteriophytochrome)